MTKHENEPKTRWKVGGPTEKVELKRELKNIFDKIHGRAKSGTACRPERHAFAGSATPPAPTNDTSKYRRIHYSR